MFLFYSISVGINGFFRYNKFQQEFLVKLDKLDELKIREKRVNIKLNNLKNDSAWEDLSRNKLNMIKKDERVYRFYFEGKYDK